MVLIASHLLFMVGSSSTAEAVSSMLKQLLSSDRTTVLQCPVSAATGTVEPPSST